MVHFETEHLPIGDLEYLNHLATISSRKAARELVASAPGAVTKEIELIKSAIADNNPDLLKEACHALRGACYSVQGRRLAHITQQMENCSTDIDDARQLLKPLEEVSNDTIAWWHHILEKDLICG